MQTPQVKTILEASKKKYASQKAEAEKNSSSAQNAEDVHHGIYFHRMAEAAHTLAVFYAEQEKQPTDVIQYHKKKAKEHFEKQKKLTKDVQALGSMKGMNVMNRT